MVSQTLHTPIHIETNVCNVVPSADSEHHVGVMRSMYAYPLRDL